MIPAVDVQGVYFAFKNAVTDEIAIAEVAKKQQMVEWHIQFIEIGRVSHLMILLLNPGGIPENTRVLSINAIRF